MASRSASRRKHLNLLERIGWVLSIVFPLAGIAIGIYLIVKERIILGAGVIVVSLVMMSIWASFWDLLQLA